MPLPDANKKSPRVYTNLQNLNLDDVTFANVQSTGNPIAVEELNEDEMRRLVLVNLARLVCEGEWNGLLTAGGGSFNPVLSYAGQINATYNLNQISMTPPWGTGQQGDDGFIRNDPQFYPFMSPQTGTVDGIAGDIHTAAASACNFVIGIYSDNDGVPGTRLGYAEIDAESTGLVIQTSITGTIELEVGEQYWCAGVRSENVSCKAYVTEVNTPYSGPNNTLQSDYWQFEQLTGSDNALPSSVTGTDLTPSPYQKFSVGLTFA